MPALILAESPSESSQVVNLNFQAESGHLIINIDSGWHINSNNPGLDFLIPTSVRSGNNLKVTYPRGKKHTTPLGEIFVYENTAKIKVEGEAKELNITIQACSDTVCLLPSDIEFKVSS